MENVLSFKDKCQGSHLEKEKGLETRTRKNGKRNKTVNQHHGKMGEKEEGQEDREEITPKLDG